MLRLLDLFSGIGGFSLGMEATKRIKTIGFVEKDKFCQKVLQKNFSNIPIEEDIRNVKGSNYTADIVSGGFPCQPFSVAGKRRGQDDDRYLWDETIRVVAETKPKWFVGENVEGIININNGLVLRQVQTDLEKEDFQVQCLVIPASGIGAWHQRKRVWIIAHSNSNRNRNEIRKSYGEEKKIQREYRQKNSTSKKSIRTNANDVPNSNSRLRRGRGTEQESRANEIWRFYTPKEEQTEQHFRSKAVGCDALFRENISNTYSKGFQRRSIPTNLEEKQRSITSKNSFEKQQTWWQTQSELCGVPNGISYKLDKDRSNRIKALGNSIVPQIAYEIGKAIVDAEISQD
ncbi:DNA (cytosine-5-)-methyltransferase (TIGR00675) [uncultured Mediterranean phage uvMED]|nr:DNA (cytosine-5-)-methyltransferase (TIGR00675) [uncultured Mediterranean phage uvMED]